jgi:Ion channel
MLAQIALGTALMLITIVTAGVSLWWVEHFLRRHHDWLGRAPHWPKLTLLLFGVAFWVLGIVTTGVWLWALTFRALDLFPTIEAAVYFALVSFTTLGYGDLLLPQDWRILGGMTAANGFIMFGLLTASVIDAMRYVRLAQITRDWPIKRAAASEVASHQGAGDQRPAVGHDEKGELER